MSIVVHQFVVSVIDCEGVGGDGVEVVEGGRVGVHGSTFVMESGRKC